MRYSSTFTLQIEESLSEEMNKKLKEKDEEAAAKLEEKQAELQAELLAKEQEYQVDRWCSQKKVVWIYMTYRESFNAEYSTSKRDKLFLAYLAEF